MMPDIVIEVAGKTGDWATLITKIDTYAADGAGYALASDPRTHETYARGACPADLVIDTEAIITA